MSFLSFIQKIAVLAIFILIQLSHSLFAQNVTNKENFRSGLVEGLDTLGLDTGDLLFAQSKTFNGIMTRIGTCSPYTHSAMVFKDKDSSLWLLHATDNNYHGNRMSVKNEEKGRAGVIMTRLEDIFITTDGGETGFYKSIRFRKLDDILINKPDREKLLAIYQKYREWPFESSKIRFVLSSTDLYIGNRDLLSIEADSAIMCSELVMKIFRESEMLIPEGQNDNEMTPKDVYQEIDDFYQDPIIFRFKNGKYQF